MEPNTDYVSLHLAWIDEHKTYRPPFFESEYKTYKEQMVVVYQNINENQSYSVLNRYAYSTLTFDIKNQRHNQNAMRNLLKTIFPTETGSSSRKFFFITIGFDHDYFRISRVMPFIKQMLGWEWIVSCKANFEYHRKVDGCVKYHPHIHFFVGVDNPRFCKQRVIDCIWRVKDVPRLLGNNKSNIDVKKAGQHHMDYILLYKVPEKMEMVELDKKWRSKNNIPDFEKNWTDIQFVES